MDLGLSGAGWGGPIYFSKIKEVAKSCEGMIEILDPTFSSEELKVELKNSQLFVYPSLAEKGETFGLSVLEAMSLGCVPIVSSLELLSRPRGRSAKWLCV